MVDRIRRLTLRFYRDNPDHAEILQWLDTLSSQGRGIKLNRKIEEALARHARSELKKMKGRKKAVVPQESPPERPQPPRQPAEEKPVVQETPEPEQPESSNRLFTDVAKRLDFG